MQVGLLVPDGADPWVGAEVVDCGVLGVEAGVPKGATVYAPRTIFAVAATCAE